MTIRLQLAHRAPGEFHSIEELFGSISRDYPEWVQCSVAVAPRRRASLASLVANLRWARGLKDCDLIHQTGDIHYAVLGMWRCPVMLTIHDLRFIEEAGGIKRFLFWWLWLFLPCLRADRVTVISEFTKSRLLQLCRVNPAKIRVIPNCVSTAFTPAPKPWPTDRPQVLLVGTTDNKNLGRVVDACAGLDVRLVILGRPTEAQQTQLAQSGLEHESHHRLASEAVVALYQSCDLVCFVSTYEGFGMPILEGQAVGRPVLTSNISPMGEVAGEGALKVDPFDVVAIRAGLKRLLDEPDLREVLIEEGFRNVAKYSAKSVAAQYAELYREIVAQRV